MKITRKQLRLLIFEATKIIVDDDGVATPADVAFKSGRRKTLDMAAMHPKIGELMGDLDDLEIGIPLYDDEDAQASRNQARAFAVALGAEELSPAEKLATDVYGQNRSEYDASSDEVTIEFGEPLITSIKAGAKNAIKKFVKGIKYAEDIPIEELRVYSEDDDPIYSRDYNLKFIAGILGCNIEELAVIPKANVEDKSMYEEIKRYVESGNWVPGSASRYGTDIKLVYEINGVKILVHTRSAVRNRYENVAPADNMWFCGK